MKKFLKVMIVLLTIAAVATPAVVFAEDRLSLSGQLRVRGFIKDNNGEFNDDADDSKEYFDERLRVGGKIAVAEGVAVNFRYDLYDSTWGDGQINGNSLNDADNKAYLTIDKGMFTLEAGKSAHALGNAIAIDTLGDMVVVDLKTAVPVQFSMTKVAEGSTVHSDDADLYTLATSHKTDLYTGGVFLGYLHTGNTAAGADSDVKYVVGANADFNLDAALVKFELNFFGGDNGLSGAAAQDYVGMNVYVDASAAVTETMTVGGILTYAPGSDKADEVAITELSDDGSFLPETYGTMATLFSVYPGSTFDPDNTQSGVMGLQVYATAKATDDVTLKGSVAYAGVAEDTNNVFDSFITAVASAKYAIAPGTALDLSLAYTMPDAAAATTADDASMVAGFRLAANF